ncbi:hypothetical protein ACQPZJ_42885 [Actinoplanes sp. CA-054009]
MNDVDDERVGGSLAVLGGALLGAFLAVIVLGALFVVSPASFVSLLPDWLVDGGSHRDYGWVLVGIGVVAALVLAFRDRGSRAQVTRGAVIVVVVLLGAGLGILAYKHRALPEKPEPAPVNTCVAYSGGRQTCPGG